MDTLIFLPISIISLHLLIIVAKALLEISRRAMQKHARAYLALPAIDAGHDDAGAAMAVVDLLVVKYASNVKISGTNEVVECPFCLSNVEEGDEIRELKCKHLFHRACLDKWLMLARPATCPLCRSALAPLDAAPTTAKHFGDDEEEDDDSLLILFSCIDVNGWFSR